MMMNFKNKKWKFMALTLVIMLFTSNFMAFAAFESLSKDPDRLERFYMQGETAIFRMKVQNTGDTATNTYYYIEDIFTGDLDHITMYRDIDGDEVIDMPALVEGVDYLIDGNTIVLRWIDGEGGDPIYIGEGTPFEQEIPTFPGNGDKTLSLAPGDFAYMELHYEVQPGDSGYLFNSINTMGEDSTGDTLTASVDTWIRVINPAIDIEKYVNSEDADSQTGPMIPVGNDVMFTFEVTNTGDIDLENVVVTDDIFGEIGTIPLLAVGATDTSLTHGPIAAMEGQHTNIATAEGEPPYGPNVTDSDPANYFGAAPGIDIEKYVNGEDADSTTGPMIPVGDDVLFTFDVTNTGNVDLVDVMVTDDVYGPIGMIALLPVGATDSTLTYGPVAAMEGQHTNMATATDGNVSDEDPANYFGTAPGIDIEKYVNGEDADSTTGPMIPVGDDVLFTFEVTNTGNVDLVDIEVTDDVYGFIGMIDSLAVGATDTSLSYGPIPAEEGQHTNMATATDGNVSDSDPANYYGEMPPGEEGLTPGYWKNNAINWEAVSWMDYMPSDSFESVFGVDITLRGKGKMTYDDPTLLQALEASGGGINALARHATAALLNASHPEIDYPMSVSEIISAVQDAVADGSDAIEELAMMLDMYNNYGADLDMHGNVITW